MNIEELKVLLQIKSKDFQTFLKTEDVQVPENGELLNQDILKNGIQKLRYEKAHIFNKENEVSKFIYKILLIIYYKTTPEERFEYLNSLLRFSYDLLNEELIRIKQNFLIISYEEYKNIVRKIIPVIKMDLFTNNDTAKELYEYLVDSSILKEDCYEIIHKKFESKKVIFLGYKIEHLSNNLGFMGEYARLKIDTSYKDNKETHNFFVKFLPKNHDELRTQMTAISFIKESTFYTKYIPLLEKMGLKELTDFLPPCYLQSDSFIIFEDVSTCGYQIPEFNVNLDDKQLSVAFTQMAKLHASSIILEDKLNELTNEVKTLDEYFPELTKEMFIQDSSDPFTSCTLKNLLIQIERFPHIVKDLTIEEFKKHIENKIYNKIYSGFRKSSTYKNVLCHGDVWWKNIMYKKDENNQPTDCFLIDFQMCRYVPPALELLILVHMCTDLATREKHLPNLLKEYYTNLKSVLTEYNVDIEESYNYNKFIQSIDELKSCAVYIVTFNHLVMFIPEEKLSEILADPIKGQHFWTVDRQDVYNEVWNQLPLDRLDEDVKELYALCLKD